MTQLEIKDEKTRLIDINDSLFKHAKDEGRSMNEEEKATFQKNLRALEDLNLVGASNKLKGEDGKAVTGFENVHIAKREKFSMIRTIRELANRQPVNDVARDMNIMGAKEFTRSGIISEGGIILPSSYESRTIITAGTATQGQEIVEEDKKAILPPLVDKLIFSQAGATFMPGLVGNVSIPSYAGTVVDWKAEVTTSVDGGGAFTEVNFTPKRLTGHILVSKTFLAQDGVGAERLLLDNIANAVARKLESTILGPATVHADYPSGIGYRIHGSNANVLPLTGATITWAAMVGLEGLVDTSNALQGNLAYMTNSIGRRILKTVDKGTANDTGDYLMSEDNMINGYPCLVTNSIGSGYGQGTDGNLVVFANWADLMIAQWGGYDITVDPYTAAKTNQVTIVINAYFDAKGLRGVTGTGASLDEYAKSFATLSIK